MKSTKKKKRWVMPVCLIVLLAVLAGAYAFITISNSQREEEEEAVAEAEALDDIISMDSSEVELIRYTNESGEIELVRVSEETEDDDAVWMITQSPDMPIKSTPLTGLLNYVSSVTPTAIIADTLDDAATYGLDDPNYTLYVRDENGSEATLYIGSENAYSETWYAELEGDSHIYMVRNYLVTRLQKEIYEYCDAGLTEYDYINSNYVKETDQNDFTMSLQLYDEVQEDLTWCDYYCWYLTSPDGDVEAADADSCAYFLEALGNITTNDCVAFTEEDDELKAYGLTDDMAIRYDLSASTDEGEDEEVTYWFGDTTEDGEVYFRSSQNAGVFTVDASLVNDVLDYDLRDFYTKGLILINIEKVDAVEVTIDGETRTLSIEREEVEAETEEDESEDTSDEEEEEEVEFLSTYFLDGEEIDESIFKSYYTSTISVYADRAMTEDEEPVDVDPYITLTFYTELPNFPTVTFEFTYFDTNFYEATINGQTRMLVNRNDIADLAAMFDEEA